MTGDFWLFFSGAIAAGLITSVSPCPMTTNIAAISYIGRQVRDSRKLLLSGVLYAAGRMTVYVLLAYCILSLALCSGESLTRFFAVEAHFWLGPPLILIGMTLIGMFTFSFPGLNSEYSAKLTERLGLFSAFPLGAAFALAFCPTSAATFLTLLGLAAEAKSTFLLPCAFGLATAAPVLAFSVILAFVPQSLGGAFNLLTRIDFWLRNTAGIIFIAVGIYYSVIYVWIS